MECAGRRRARASTGGRSTRDSPRSASPEFLRVPPAEAVAAFCAKGLHVGFDWRDTDAALHARSFTVVKAIAEGVTFEAFQERLEPTLHKKGWLGRQAMTDPVTGETRLVQLGSPRRRASSSTPTGHGLRPPERTMGINPHPVPLPRLGEGDCSCRIDAACARPLSRPVGERGIVLRSAGAVRTSLSPTGRGSG